MRTVAINNGYSFIKSDLGLSFKSVYKEVSMTQFTSGKADIISLDGKTYTIGQGSPAIDKDKTDSIATKLFVLTMLCKHMDTTHSEHFKVYLTAPPLTYPRQKEALPQYLIGSYKVTYNNQPKEIYIDAVTVLPETIMAYLANNPSKFKRDVIVIDIGGLTTNLAYIKDGVYNGDSIKSFVNGMYQIENDICDYLNNKYWNLDLDPSQMTELLQNGIYIGDGTENIIETNKDAINDILSRYVDKIVHKLTLSTWNPDMCEILVTGGGGKVLYNLIHDVYPQAIISNDPIFDNLNGMQAVIMKEMYQRNRECAASGVR